MNNYSIVLSSQADKYFKRCDTSTQKRLRDKFASLKADPFDPRQSKALKGRNEQRSARVGGLRILFRVEEAVIIVAAIAPRGQVYKHDS